MGAKPALVIVVALKAEARPLVEALGLKPAQNLSGGLPVFRSNDGQICLLRGRASASAIQNAMTELSRAGLSSLEATWLNIGVVGAIGADVGTMLTVDRVIDESGSHCWNLASNDNIDGSQNVLCGLPSTRAVVRTVKEPVIDLSALDESFFSLPKVTDSAFRWTLAVDMEAAGFCAGLDELSVPKTNRYCLKVVSDTSSQPCNGLSAARVSELIAPLADSLAVILRRLRGR